MKKRGKGREGWKGESEREREEGRREKEEEGRRQGRRKEEGRLAALSRRAAVQDSWKESSMEFSSVGNQGQQCPAPVLFQVTKSMHIPSTVYV